jgi:radical SAM superfamily enzyme YgiQ (UPF0313 family)
MHVLLLYPQFPDTFWSFKYALEFVGKRAALPPLGLITIAAMLPQAWSLRLVDTNVRALTDEDLAWADCAFLSAMAVQRDSAHRLVSRCKAAGLRVVAGGPLFTSEYEQFPAVDHFVLNEAELSLPPFLTDLARGEPQRLYTALTFADLTQSPIPRWDLLDLRRYAGMSLQFSRGCPFNCEFCNVTTLFGHRVRIKTTAQILAELDHLHALGWRSEVFFVDDNFIGNRHFLKTELLPALIAWRQQYPGHMFFTEASINLADDADLMELMVRAGFFKVFIGIETPDEQCLAECDKGQNRHRDLVADVRRIQRAGLQVQGGFIVGFDHDQPSIFQRQIDFIQQSGIVTAMVGLLQAPLGTRLYQRLAKEGRLCAEFSGDNVDGTTNIIPVMNLDTLRDGYRRLLHHLYAPAPYYQRIQTFLREYRAPHAPRRLEFADLLAIARSIFRIGLLGRERYHYWKLLLWTQCRRPRLMIQAITLAIYGYHFRKTCERHVKKPESSHPQTAARG